MTKNKLPNLDKSLLAALNHLQINIPPKFNLKIDKLPLVVGSGNAFNAGKVMLADRPAIFATESDFKQKLKSYQSLIKSGIIKQAIIISASGEKDAVWEIMAAKKAKLKTILMTCSPRSQGAKLADKIIVYSKIPEPQTYNISTYLGMILSSSQESPKKIKDFIQKIKLPKNFTAYKAYAFILPDEFSAITSMIEIKKHELFGPHLSVRAFSCGEARHAKFVMPWNKELVISFGKNMYFGLKDHRYQITMPKNYGPGLVMALSYYLVGKIQANKPPYYQQNIAKYCQDGPKAYGKNKPFNLIVK